MAVLSFKNHILYNKIRDTQSKSDFVFPYQYSGVANVGILESDNYWVINRIDFTIPGSPVIETAVGSWDNRYSLIYG